VRILFIPCAHKSHLYQMVPLAWALRGAGHQVFVASAPDPGLTSEDVTSTGLTAVSAGEPVDIGAMAQEEAPKIAPVSSEESGAYRKAGQADYSNCDVRVELEQMARIYPVVFSSKSMVDELIAFSAEWRPDLVVWDHLMMFTGPAVARSCGAASARLVYCPDSVSQLRMAYHDRYGRPDPIESGVRDRFADFGLDFDPSMVDGDWTINCMPSWTWKPEGRHYLGVRPMSFNGPSAVPKWLHEQPTRRRVCITLGLTSRGVHSTIPSVENLFAAVAGLDVEVVATLAPEHVADLPSIPDNVRVVEFVPMNTLLATCSAILHHGGAGTVFSALEHGIPQIILPSTFANEKFWGQVGHAEGLERQGAGIYVDTARPVTAEELRDHLVRVLDDPSYARNAARLRTELLEMPAPNDIVPIVSRLTAEHRAAA
jgi:glycosyltransferase (activator-dependent family)